MALRAPPVELAASAWRPVIIDFTRRAVQSFQNGQTLTSWWRSALGNQSVGGHRDSQHLLGLAVDVVGPSLRVTRDLARRQGLTAVLEGDHLHLQMFPPGALRRAGVRFPRPPVVGAFAPNVETRETERFA